MTSPDRLLEKALREAQGPCAHGGLPCSICTDRRAAITRGFALARKVGALEQAEHDADLAPGPAVQEAGARTYAAVITRIERERDRLRAELEKEEKNEM